MKQKLLALLAAASVTVSSQALAVTYYWSVDKSVDQPEVTLSWGQSVTVQWTVSYTFYTGGDPFGGDIDECIDASDPRFLYEETICGANTTVTFTEIFGPYSYQGDDYWEDVFLNEAYFMTNDTGTEGYDSATVTLHVGDTSVPEPGTLALLSLGLAGLGLSRRRRVN